METIICLAPLIWTILALWIGWLIGRYGSPVRWVGFRRRRRIAPAEEDDE
jgi:hypothetical protein